MLFLLLAFACSGIGTAGAQGAVPQKTGGVRTDVVLFVDPVGPASARIGLAYRARVPHGRVLKEITRLVSGGGWTLSAPPSITDKTVHPENPRRFPPVTGAMFSVDNAPQVHDNAPVLAPYLRAFQTWNSLEILYVCPDLSPYNGVVDFRSPALDVTLDRSEGIYRYQVRIRDHAAELPALIPDPHGPISFHPTASGAEASPAREPAAVAAPDRSLRWPMLFIIAGALMTTGVGLFVFSRRHGDPSRSARLP